MKKLALDIDSVTAEIISPMCEILASGEKPEDVIYWDYIKDKYGNKAFWKAYNYIWENKLVAILDKGIQDFLKEMRKLNIQVDYVTVRNKELEEPTREWLQEKRLLNEDNCLIIVNKMKGKIELGYDYYVDDCPNMTKWMRPFQTLFLYNRPWNSINSQNSLFVREWEPRVNNLIEVTGYLRKDKGEGSYERNVSRKSAL